MNRSSQGASEIGSLEAVQVRGTSSLSLFNLVGDYHECHSLLGCLLGAGSAKPEDGVLCLSQPSLSHQPPR